MKTIFVDEIAAMDADTRLFIDTLLKIADEKLSRYRFDAAIEFAHLVLEKDRVNVDAHGLLARAYLAKGDEALALSHVQTVRNLTPDEDRFRELLDELKQNNSINNSEQHGEILKFPLADNNSGLTNRFSVLDDISFHGLGADTRRENWLIRLSNFLDQQGDLGEPLVFWGSGWTSNEWFADLEDHKLIENTLAVYCTNEELFERPLYFKKSGPDTNIPDIVRLPAKYLILHLEEETIESDFLKQLFHRGWLDKETIVVNRNSVTPKSLIGNPNPLLYLTSVSCGNGSMRPTIYKLIERAGRVRQQIEMGYGRKRRHTEGLVRSDPALISKDTAHEIVSNLNYFDVLEIHGGIDARAFEDIKNLDILASCRDPRDVLVSAMCQTHALYPYEYGGPAPLDSNVTVPMMADVLKSSFYVKNLCEGLLAAFEMENARLIRFEDVKRDPRNTYIELLNWLSWPVAISERELMHDIELASFLRRTGGLRERGAKADAVAVGNHGFARRGTTGDWKNHFTPEITDLFKEQAGDALIKLGYETSTDW